jgi:uncharacterized membrane protein YphA (DoxX/SURF4 family)
VNANYAALTARAAKRRGSLRRAFASFFQAEITLEERKKEGTKCQKDNTPLGENYCGRWSTLFGILLITGFKIRMASVLSGPLLLSFAIGMVTGLGIKTPFDYSVFSAAAAAFLLAFWEPDRFTLDKLLNRLRN